MMQPEITLSYTDETGQLRRVVIHAPRFTIGRGSDNDLVINDSNLSRRHAVLEIFDGTAHIADCGSRNGTTLNGQPVTGPVEVSDRDIVTLGGACNLTMSITAGSFSSATIAKLTNNSAAAHDSHEGRQAASTVSAPAPGTTSFWLNPPVIVASAVIGLILVVAGALIAVSLEEDEEESDVAGTENRSPMSNTDEVKLSTPGTTKIDGTTGLNPADDAAISPEANTSVEEFPGAAGPSEQIGRAAKRVMTRISTDSMPYISDAGIKDVAAKVNEYRGSAALAGRIRSAARGCGEITALARSNNLKSTLLTYAALAQSESDGDPISIARQMTPKLLTLRATFGTETANSSLLLVAAYPYPFNPPIGSQTRTAHPLASKLMEFGGRRSVEDTSVARSVWFLREKNGITPEAYNLVVRLLAIGIIAQDPQRYGIETAPLLC